MPKTEMDRGEVLVSIINNKADMGILRERQWYRIPVAKAPKRWPPKWLALYQTRVFENEAYSDNCYGQVRDIQIVRRRELFPNVAQPQIGLALLSAIRAQPRAPARSYM
jgi:hypothetical protein